MPDPSADRPLLLPESDLQLVIDAMAEAQCYCSAGFRCSSHWTEAEAALTALAAAGRLLLASAERSEWMEFGTETVYPAGHDFGPAVVVHPRADAEGARVWAEVVLRRGATSARPVRRSKVMYVGRWVEVDPAAEEE